MPYVQRDETGKIIGQYALPQQGYAEEFVDLIQESADDIIARLEGALDNHLDKTANSYRYFSIGTMCDYRDDANPKFNAEGKAAYAWRSACYTIAIELIGKVQSGEMAVPTEAELIALMPKITDFMPVVEATI